MLNNNSLTGHVCVSIKLPKAPRRTLSARLSRLSYIQYLILSIISPCATILKPFNVHNLYRETVAPFFVWEVGFEPTAFRLICTPIFVIVNLDALRYERSTRLSYSQLCV